MTLAATELKQNIRHRWSLPERVRVWMGSSLNAEFTDPFCRRAWTSALHQAVADTPVWNVLDAGTGPGTIAQLWTEMGYATTGLDFSTPMIEAARASAAEKKMKITFIEGDVEAPPFQKKKFDVISSRFVLFTLPHPGYTMRRWVHLLRPGGRIILIGHEHSTDPKHHPRRKNNQPLTQTEKRHKEILRQLPFVHHTPGDLIVLLEAVGLSDIRRIPMDQVIAARTALNKRNKELKPFRSTPFIIVGRKGP